MAVGREPAQKRRFWVVRQLQQSVSQRARRHLLRRGGAVLDAVFRGYPALAGCASVEVRVLHRRTHSTHSVRLPAGKAGEQRRQA